MFSLDDRPALPDTPVFRADMERFLVSVASSRPRRSPPTRRALVAVAAGVAAAAVAIGAAVVFHGTGHAPGRVEAGSVHVHLADFSVDTNPGGTVTVTLSQAQILDPDALGLALAQAGVHARITTSSFCYNPGITSRPPAFFQAVATHQPGPGKASDVVMVITPSKLPPGSTLAIAYIQPPAGGLPKADFSLLTAGAPVTCSSNPPPVIKGPTPAPANPVPAAQ